MSQKKYQNPFPFHQHSADFIQDRHLSLVFLWNAYMRDAITEAQYENGVQLAQDGWLGTPQELVEAARKL